MLPTLQVWIQVKIVGGDHVELTIHWSPQNKQKVTALIDAEAKRTQVHGNSQKLSGPLSFINGDGEQTVMVRKFL